MQRQLLKVAGACVACAGFFLASGVLAETLTYTYDVHGQVTGVSRSSGTSSSYAYDNAANRTSVATSGSLAKAATSKAATSTPALPTWSDFSEPVLPKTTSALPAALAKSGVGAR